MRRLLLCLPGRGVSEAGPSPALTPRIRPGLRYGLAAVLLAAAAVGAWLGWRSREAAKEKEEALRLCDRGRFEAAEPFLLKALGREPNEIHIVRALALGYVKARHHRKATVYLARWCELEPDSAEPHLLRWQDFLDVRDWERARAEAERVLKIQPDNLKVMRGMVSGLHGSGRFAEAEQACQRFLARRPEDPILLYLLAETYHAQDRDAEAAAVLDRVLPHMPPDFGEPWRLRGILHSHAAEDGKAVAALQRALTINPGDDRAWHQLGLVLARLGRTGEAEMQMEALLQKLDYKHLVTDLKAFAGHPDLQLRVARHLLAGGHLKEGLRLVKDVLAQHPGWADALELLRKYEGDR